MRAMIERVAHDGDPAKGIPAWRGHWTGRGVACLTEEHYRKFRLRSLVEEVVAVTIAFASGHPPFHAVDLIDL